MVGDTVSLDLPDDKDELLALLHRQIRICWNAEVKLAGAKMEIEAANKIIDQCSEKLRDISAGNDDELDEL